MAARKILSSKFFWGGLMALVAIAGLGHTAIMMAPMPDDLDFSLTRGSEQGLFVTSLDTGAEPITIGAMHVFTVTLKTPAGRPVERAAIAVDGGMPQHGHGLPTSPRVTADLGMGRYRIEGMKFNMPGWWTVTIHAKTTLGSDATTFNLKL